MKGEEDNAISNSEEKIFQIFSEFMTRATKFEELVVFGHRLFLGFQQGLEFLRRSPVSKTSELVENIIKANETKRVKSYVEAGCINSHDSIQNISKLHTCHAGLQEHMTKAKSILDELKCLVEDATKAMQSSNECLLHFADKDFDNGLDQQATSYDKEEIPSSHSKKPEVTEYAAMMGILYCMVKQDYMMQQRIVSSLNLKSSSGELDSYSLMWSLRPFINDEIMHRAWKLIP